LQDICGGALVQGADFLVEPCEGVLSHSFGENNGYFYVAKCGNVLSLVRALLPGGAQEVDVLPEGRIADILVT
jgi:hypothetical protein